MTDKTRGPADLPIGDAVPEELHPLLQKLLDNIKAIVLGIVVVLAAVGGYALVQHMQASNLAEARETLGRIMTGPAGQGRVDALEALLADAPGSMATAVRLALARAQTEAGLNAKAAETWQALAQTKGLEIVAALGRATALSRAGDHKAALEALTRLKPVAPEEYAAHIARLSAAEAEAAGDPKAALAAYRELKALGAVGNQAYLDHKIGLLQQEIAAGQPAS